MSGSPEQDRIELEVKDSGPIVEAKIHLRTLTVFVGSSNIGKSRLATLIYALHRCFSGAAGTDYQGVRTSPRHRQGTAFAPSWSSATYSRDVGKPKTKQ